MARRKQPAAYQPYQIPPCSWSREPFFPADRRGLYIELFTLQNIHGLEACITNYGGIVTSLKVPDRKGRMADIVLGYDTLSEYINRSPYFGCILGRYANRIAGARFELGGKVYPLIANNGPNHLHGGAKGFDKVVWEPRPTMTPDGPAVELRYLSRDGEEGYPGNLSVTATYALTNDDTLRLDCTATTDQETIVNLTHHSYFNLAGGGDILDHELMIAAEAFTPVGDGALVPTGELRPVRGTPFDFTSPTRIGARIDDNDEQLRFGKGYNHNFVLSKPPGELGLAARVHEPASGRVLEVLTTEPGLHFYSGNALDGSYTGKGGKPYSRRCAFCLEPQHFPDSPNKPHFPSVVLRPGESYRNTMVYRFSAK